MTEFIEGNRITLLKSGAEYFPALEAACDAARREIHIETYIFEDDVAGRRIGAALERAARRGVAAHLLVDGYGSRGLNRALIADLQGAGVKFLVYRPDIAPLRFQRHRLRRMHRKLAVIDARVAFVGGINIIDDMHTPGHTPPRFDYAVQVEGPVLEGIHAAAKRLWALLEFMHFGQDRHDRSPIEVDRKARGGQRAAFVVRDNLRHRRDIEEAYLAAIAAARSEILIANAYFFPGHSFRRTLMDAAARGVRVMLLLQGRVEYVLLHYASRALYGVFLDAGIEIHEYHKSFLHAKVAVIDRSWATVGSSNIDPFSLLLAREANLVVKDAAFAADLRRHLVAAMTDGAREVKREIWAHQPLPRRAATWLAYGVARLLTGAFAYGRAREFT
ncbi:MAG: cardiolipin synthase ClsB [Betaproteobacteria bacterium]|nr:cardiolipin synthase ClsB [Betaproteobacteria bacterium]